MLNLSSGLIESPRSKILRSKFRIPALLLAGTALSAGLSVMREASALSGTLTSSQVVTSPRESGGAGGGATLIHTAASTTASAPETTTASSTNAPAEETPAARSSGGGTRRHAQTEEGGRTRRRGTTTEETTTTRRRGRTTANGKNVRESKDKVVRLTPPPDKPIFSISTGIESRYIFHGLDIISFNTDQRNSRDTHTSAIYYVGADAAYKGAHFGVTYVQSFDRLHPYLTSVFFGQNNKEFYQELDFNLDYTAHVVANILDVTVGYNSYVFLDSGFKGSNYQGEVLFRLAYKQIPYITPSFTYYDYVSEFHDTRVGSLNGSLTEFRIDGLFPVYKSPEVSVSFAPYVSSVYNINYLNWDHPTAINSGNNVGGWSYLETGIKIPVTIAKHFTVTPYANYGTDLTSGDTTPINSHAYHDKTGFGIYGEKTLFWFGVTASYNF